jgi:hemerythrin-like domain-containing protein
MLNSPEIQVNPEDVAGILKAFDTLAPEGAMVVVANVPLHAMLLAFQAERRGAFDWNVLQVTPRFRVEVRRRAEAGPRTVSEALETDHRRLDAMLEQAERLVGEGLVQEAAARAAQFVCGLERHIEMEEQVLFPAFEERTGLRTGPTEVMRHEHRAIRSHLGEITSALAEGSTARFRTAAEALVEVLGQHNMKEERILYPMADRSAGSAEARDELVRRMQRL